MLLECVPNLSEGRRPRVIERLAAAAEAGGATLLDRSSDPDHNRTVLTLAGGRESLEGSVLALVGAAIEELDLRAHHGVHPRMGAVDVVPFVPLGDATMADAVALARAVGEALARRFALPVYLYGAAARRPERTNLAKVRGGGFEELERRIEEPGWEPDFGPRAVHPTAGATAVGARFFLIAFNVLLATSDVSVARQVAAAVRESGGGLPAVKALGLYLESRRCSQVSMNLVDYRLTPPRRAFERVREEAARRGVGVAGSEIVGLVPRAALAGGSIAALQLEGFAERQILEHRLQAMGLGGG